MRFPTRRLALLVAAAAGAVASRERVAHALDPFEIQVYEGDMNAPLEAALEVHANYVARGRSQPAFAGEVVPDGALRVTLEPALGILPWFEAGAYLQTVTLPASPEAHWGGFKLRGKFIVPRAKDGRWTIGLNVEVGRGVAALGSDHWHTEWRPIVAWQGERWLLDVNPIFGWELASGASAAPDLEPAGKIRFDTRLGFGVGVEYYAGLGLVSDFAAPAAQEHVVYLTGDLIGKPIELNLGIGRGLSDASEPWTIKLIVGRGF